MENKNTISFSDPEIRQIFLEWWENLDESRGKRAELRHCHNINEVAFTPSFHSLRIKLSRFRINQEALAAIAGVLSHVKSNDTNSSLPAQMAIPKLGSKKAAVSDLRFRRLLTIEDRNELFITMIRIVRLLDERVNIFDLAKSIYFWNKRTKKRLAYKYYENIPVEKKK
ncbi:type I-E CRISPR-associated protein Cse2/CasB [Methanosarcina barkeri]|uniref:CRISPR-associated protein CasB/Cse2 CasB n=1 Tax=Methanosarcina barkeri CM1 TaxID=796385 RepID=A0A0G3CDU0_METBA|nr:type I-E CRISPR-associated protein Cse2/CasB [Methanosarcina barkeri]AKJ38920.1 CRISPR-associated protein CasB/Cse2 CasB [Methanosarcina barkeri CM1]